MNLRNIDFGNVLGASGVQGFFGEGYWFHRFWKPFGLDFSGTTFVAKTTTLLGRKGHMPLNRDFSPRELIPDSIKAKLLRGSLLNAVSLSGPGIGALLGTGLWQERTEPFWISLMSLANTKEERLEELRLMIAILTFVKVHFKTKFGLQINVSCPNTGHDIRILLTEIIDMLEIVKVLNVPIMLKFAVDTATPDDMMVLADHPDCDAICVSNTIKFGWNSIDWERAWGSNVSPLAHLGGGGLSGEVLRPLVCGWIKRVRDRGFTKHINGGGGILHPDNVYDYYRAGASSIFLGSIAALRPWRVARTIAFANSIEWQ